jgi:hypothetical protein
VVNEPYRIPCQLCQGTRVIRRLFGRAPMACPWCCSPEDPPHAAKPMAEETREAA